MARADALAIRRSVAVGALFAILIAVLLVAGLLVGPRMLIETSTLLDRLPALAIQIDSRLDRALRELVEAVPVFRRVLPEGGGWIHQLVPDRPRGPERLPRARRAPLLAHDPRPVLRLLSAPGHAADRHRGHEPAAPQHVETSVAVWRELNGVIGRYIRGVVLDGIVVGILAAVGLWAVRVPYPPALGAFAGIANVVPFVGPLLSAAAAGLVVLMNPGQGLGGVVRVAVLFLAIKVLDDTVIQPLTIGRSVHLHPALLLGSVVVGNHTLGVLGMIIAVPVATVLQETVRLLLEHRRVLASRSLRSGAGRLGE